MIKNGCGALQCSQLFTSQYVSVKHLRSSSSELLLKEQVQSTLLATVPAEVLRLAIRGLVKFFHQGFGNVAGDGQFIQFFLIGFDHEHDPYCEPEERNKGAQKPTDKRDHIQYEIGDPQRQKSDE